MAQLKLKRVELEISENLSNVTAKKGESLPFLKRWRLWCNGVSIGDIIKLTEKQKDGSPNYRIWIHKGDTGDTYAYKRTKLKKGVKFEYDKNHVDPRTWDGYKTLKEAYKAGVEQFRKNITHFMAE